MGTIRLFTNIAQLVTPVRLGVHRGAEMTQVQRSRGCSARRAGRHHHLGGAAHRLACVAQTRWLTLAGRAVVPALVDPHTHAIWAGDRLDDFEARLQGVPYEQILARGGGIYHTIRHTAQASVEELIALTIPRIQQLMRIGRCHHRD
jgi:imidazolonepropionase